MRLVNTTGNDGTVKALVAVGHQAPSQRTNVLVRQTLAQEGVSHCYEILGRSRLGVHHCGHVCTLPQVVLWLLWLLFVTPLVVVGGGQTS